MGCTIYDTKVKYPVSSYSLKWGACLLPRPFKSQKNYIHWIEVFAPVTKKYLNQVRRMISQHSSVRQISCFVQSLFMRYFGERFWWNILMRNFDESFWWDILIRYFDETFWCYILMRYFDETFLSDILMKHSDVTFYETFW